MILSLLGSMFDKYEYVKMYFTAFPDEDQCDDDATNDCEHLCIEELDGYTYVTLTSLGD